MIKLNNMLLGLTCILGILIMLGCSSKRNNNKDDADALSTLHKSTFSHVTGLNYMISMPFDNNRKAIISDNIWKNKKMFLVDFENQTVKTIELPRKENTIRKLIYAGKEVIAVFMSKESYLKDLAYAINANGEIRELEHVSLIRPNPNETIKDVYELIRKRQPQNLINLRTEICKLQSNSSYKTTQLSIVEYFYNEKLFIQANMAEQKDPLRPFVIQTIDDDLAKHTLEQTAKGYTVKVERNTALQTYESDLDQRISKVHIIKGEKVVKSFDFDQAGTNYFFYLLPKGNRLYFIGNDVKYLDIDKLDSPTEK